jgi:hypothetical protein
MQDFTSWPFSPHRQMAPRLLIHLLPLLLLLLLPLFLLLRRHPPHRPCFSFFCRWPCLPTFSGFRYSCFEHSSKSISGRLLQNLFRSSKSISGRLFEKKRKRDLGKLALHFHEQSHGKKTIANSVYS